MNKKIFFYALRDYDEKDIFLSVCEEAGVEYGYTSDYPSMENAYLAKGCSGISIITNPIGSELTDRFYELGVRHISTRTIGMDHIDLAHCQRIGMRVSNVSYAPDAVAEYTVMMMLMALRKMPYQLKQEELQNFALKGKIGRELRHCTVGIIGTGRIGRAVIRILSGFGCRIHCYDVAPALDQVGDAEYVSMERLLSEADIISLHAPGMAETFHMLGADEIRRMKQGVILVNCARGSLIDTEAMIDALASGHIGCAALDTIENEGKMYYHDLRGIKLDHPARERLLSLPNVLLSPHVAFYTEQVVEEMIRNSVGALIND